MIIALLLSRVLAPALSDCPDAPEHANAGSGGHSAVQADQCETARQCEQARAWRHATARARGAVRTCNISNSANSANSAELNGMATWSYVTARDGAGTAGHGTVENRQVRTDGGDIVNVGRADGGRQWNRGVWIADCGGRFVGLWRLLMRLLWPRTPCGGMAPHLARAVG